MLTDKQPNPRPRALAELESRGLLDAVITQNIDRLHARAGSRRVIEVHGTIETSSCLDCGASYPLDRGRGALFDDEGVARCRDCGGPVKPDVVLFGEMLPEEAMEEAYRRSPPAPTCCCASARRSRSTRSPACRR